MSSVVSQYNTYVVALLNYVVVHSVSAWVVKRAPLSFLLSRLKAAEEKIQDLQALEKSLRSVVSDKTGQISKLEAAAEEQERRMKEAQERERMCVCVCVCAGVSAVHCV